MKLRNLLSKYIVAPVKDALHKTKELGWFFGVLAYLLSQILLWIPGIIGVIVGLTIDKAWGFGLASGYAIWVFAPTGTTFVYIPLLFLSIAIMRWVKHKFEGKKNVQGIR